MFKRCGRFLTLALFGILSLITHPGVLMASEEAAAGDSSISFGLALAAGFGMALAAFGGALAQGRTAHAALEGIARNPEAGGKLFVPMILCLVFIESLVLFTFAMCFILQGKI